MKICQQQYDEKNIRRRVYDALNVLMAMDIISKDKKEIQWRGLPRTSLNDIEELKVCPVLILRLNKKIDWFVTFWRYVAYALPAMMFRANPKIQ